MNNTPRKKLSLVIFIYLPIVINLLTTVGELNEILSNIKLIPIEPSSLNPDVSSEYKITVFYGKEITNERDNYEIVKWITPQVITRFKQNIKPIKRETVSNLNVSDLCGGLGKYFVESYLSTDFDEIILLILVSDFSSIDQIVGRPCNTSMTDGHPFVGLVSINLYDYSGSYKEINHIYKMISSALLSIFSFSDLYLDTGPLAASIISDNLIPGYFKYISSKNLMTTVGNKHPCSQLTSIPISINPLNSFSFRLSSLYFPFDVMSDMDQGYLLITVFDEAILNDTGWYTINDSLHDNVDSFYGMTCNQLGPKGKFKEVFFGKGQLLCSTDRKRKQMILPIPTDVTNVLYRWDYRGGYCSYDKLPHTSTDYESFGQSSRCLEVYSNSLITAGCFEMVCIKQSIIVYINENVYECSEEVKEIKLEEYSIKCPDFEELCTNYYDIKCKDCSGNGVCKTDGTCLCDLVYEGDRCQNVRTDLISEIENLTTSISYFAGTQFFISHSQILNASLFLFLFLIYV